MAVAGVAYTAAMGGEGAPDGEAAWVAEAAESESEEEGGEEEGAAKAMYMPPSEVEMQMKRLWEVEAGICGLIWAPASPRVLRAPEGWQTFFVRVLPVPPTRFRPPMIMGGKQFEHPQNHFLTKIINLNERVQQLRLGAPSPPEGASAAGAGGDAAAAAVAAGLEAGGDAAAMAAAGREPALDLSRVIGVWIQLQEAVNCLMDSTKTTSMEKDSSNGIKQILERKEGLFRQNLMGKRVNYAARSVISPDPYIRNDEIGVPVKFARTLTYPQPVTAWNVVRVCVRARAGVGC